MKLIVFIVATLLLLPFSAKAETTDLSKLADMRGLSIEQIDERNILIHSILDPSHGKAMVCSRLATAYLGCGREELTKVLALRTWLGGVTAQIKSNPKFLLLEKEAQKSLKPQQSLVIMYSLSEDGRLTQRNSKQDNLRSMDSMPSVAKLRDQASVLIDSITPLSAPPNEWPRHGMYFEFYLTDENKLDCLALPGIMSHPTG